jgi:hypothetical protein
MNGRCLRVGKEFLALVDDKGSGLVVKNGKLAYGRVRLPGRARRTLEEPPRDPSR